MKNTSEAADGGHPPTIIAAAPTGAYKSQRDYPGLPVTADAIAEQAIQCMQAGASMLHLHVRDEQGRHSLDADIYRRTIDAVRARCGDGLLIQTTSEQAGVYDTDSQIGAIRAIDTEFISVALAEIIGAGTEQELERAASLFRELDERGTVVQVILYSAAHLEKWNDLAKRLPDSAGTLPLLFVLGRYHRSRQSEPEDLLPFLDARSRDDPWMVCAFGARELDCMRFAASHGGHARVGFENNTLGPDGTELDSTAQSIALTASALESQGHRIASVGEARRLLLGKA